MTRIIVSLTTIPPRLPEIAPTLMSLLAQRQRPDAVELWIPRTYRRFGEAFTIPSLPDGITLRRCDEDFGPATKVLPAMRAYGGQDVRIAYCDDDILYREDWLASLIASSDQRPGHCIVEAGLPIARIAGGRWKNGRLPKPGSRPKGPAYRAKRLASLGAWKPAGPRGGGYVDIAEGFGGVLIRPEFFPEAVFDVPDAYRLVDDVWLSGHMAVNDVPIWFNRLDTPQLRFEVTELGDRHGLKDITTPGQERHKLDRACAEYFRATYGIWGGPDGAGT